MLLGEVDPRSRTQSGVSEAKLRANSPRPLDRRVSFCPLAPAASAPALDDDLKNRMRLSDTDAIESSWRPSLLSAAIYYIAALQRSRANSFSVQLPEFGSGNWSLEWPEPKPQGLARAGLAWFPLCPQAPP